MKILLINHYAGSIKHGMEYRPYYLGLEWRRLGHKVTIVGASHSHVRTVQPEMDKQVRIETIDGLIYIWLPTPSYQVNDGRRVVNMFSFVWQLLRYQNVIQGNEKHDIVIASSTYPLDIWPAYRIAKKISAKLLFEVHDLWPLSPIELGDISPRHPFILLLQLAENFAYRHADKVVSMLPNAKQHMCEHGLDPGKFVYIPNGIRVADWQENDERLPDEHQSLLNQLKQRDQFLVCYAGSHGLANSLHTLIDANAQLNSNEVSLIFVGQGPEKKALRQRAREIGQDNVYFLPPVDKSVIPLLLTQMDVLYIGLQKHSLFRFGISPNKLMDYMMAARPIISAIDAGNDPVRESGAGISVPAEDPAAVAAAIQELCLSTPEQRRVMGENGKRYVQTHHDYAVLSSRFLESIGI